MSFTLEEKKKAEGQFGMKEIEKALEQLKPDRKATKEDVNELLNFIGGFKYWSRLNEDCKMEVVKHLDYSSRCKLRICSKDDYKVVENTPMHVHTMSMSYQHSNRHHFTLEDVEFERVTVHVYFTNVYQKDRLILVFYQEGEDTKVRKAQDRKVKPPNDDGIVTLNSSNYYEEAIKFAEGWMKKCNYELLKLSIDMPTYPLGTSAIKSLPRCVAFSIVSDDVDMWCFWLKKLPEELLQLEIRIKSRVFTPLVDPSAVFNTPQVMQTHSLHVRCRNTFTDEQFLSLNAVEMSFPCENITEDGVNQFIKNWVIGKKGKHFRMAFLHSTKTWESTKIIRGIEVREWDDEFKKEFTAFSRDFDRILNMRGQRDAECFQITSRIDPYESITLSIFKEHLSIYGTGKRTTLDGNTYTAYSVPF